MDTPRIRTNIDSGIDQLTPVDGNSPARNGSLHGSTGAQAKSKREELFRAMSDEDPGRASRMLVELDPREAMELICELCVKNMESLDWESRNAVLLEALGNSVPHLVREIRNYVYDISTNSSSGTERVSCVRSNGALSVDVSRTTFLRMSVLRHTKLTSAGRKPLRYRGSIDGVEKVRATFSGSTVHWRVALTTGVLDREIEVDHNVGILDNFAWHHFARLLARYDETRGGVQNLMVFLPSIGKEIRCSLKLEGRRKMKIKDDQVIARYFTLDLQGKALVEIWINDSGSSLVLVERRQGLEVVGKELRG